MDNNTRILVVCKCCKHLKTKDERTPNPVYCCTKVDLDNGWKVYVDRHTFEELKTVEPNCFDSHVEN